MGLYSEYCVPWLAHLSLSTRPFRKIRARLLAGAQGTVLEIGFGSGLNLGHYPAAVTGLRVVEPSPLARWMARTAIAGAAFPVEFAGLDGQTLDMADASVDCAVSTWTLCTIPDAASALREIARVLKPGGRFLFAEHGLSPDAGVARWQERLNGLQRRIAGGCNLNRPIAALVAASPLRLESVERFYIKGPRTHTHMYVGTAVKAGS